jgi:ribosomal protein S18 acetylase RimI-like enzyme
MHLREATRDDIAAIAALHARSWQQHYRGAFSDEYLDGPVIEDRLQRWQGRLTSPAQNQYVVIAEDGSEEIAGFACAFGADDERWGTLLDNIHVRRDLFGRGIGGMLVAAVAGWSLAHYPACGMYLWVLEQNERAQRFYRGLGGRDVEGQIWDAPDGSKVRSRRFAWTREELATLGHVDA